MVSCSLGALQPGAMAAAEIKVLVDSADGWCSLSGRRQSDASKHPDHHQLRFGSVLQRGLQDDNNSAQVETAILGSGGEQIDLSVSKNRLTRSGGAGSLSDLYRNSLQWGTRRRQRRHVNRPASLWRKPCLGPGQPGEAAPQSAGFVACNLGSVESGASAGVQINVTIDPSIQVETLFNSVFVDSDQEDSNGDNNFDQEEDHRFW